MKIGELLIGKGLITEKQLKEGLSQQVMYGGRVGTNLVELGFLTLDDLAQALAALHGFAPVLDSDFQAFDSSLQDRISVKEVSELAAIPLRFLSDETPRAVVAFMDPPTETTLQELRRILGAHIVPAIAPELRMRFALEAIYDIPRDNRFLRPKSPKLHKPPDPASKRRYATSLNAPNAPAEIGQIILAKRARFDAGFRGAIEPEASEASARFEDVLKSIRRAKNREKIIQLLIVCLRDGFDAPFGVGAFLLVRNGRALGWSGFSNVGPEDVISSIAVPLEEPSMLKLAYETGLLVCGKPPPNGELINSRFWQLLESAAPEEVVVAPIDVDGKVIALLYAHAENFGKIPEATAHKISELAREAGKAFVRLLQGAQR